MGGVVLDTNTIARAILSPAGARRKLWLLLVYGGAVQRARLIRQEHQTARAAGASDTGALEAAADVADANPLESPQSLSILGESTRR